MVRASIDFWRLDLGCHKTCHEPQTADTAVQQQVNSSAARWRVRPEETTGVPASHRELVISVPICVRWQVREFADALGAGA